MGNVEEFSPQLIIQNIRGQISQFFFMIRKKLDDIECEIFKKVKDSDALRTLAQLVQEMNEECDESLRELVDEEKRALDEKVDKSKFSFIVIKSNFYKMLIEAMRSFNAQLKTDVAKSQKQFSDLVKFVPDEAEITNSLVQLINRCLKVDGQPVNIELRQKPDAPKAAASEQHTAFAVRENAVL